MKEPATPNSTPFIPITEEQYIALKNQMFEPFKIYGNIEEILQSAKGDRKYVKREEDGTGFAIYINKKNEKDYLEANEWLEELTTLKNKQLELKKMESAPTGEREELKGEIIELWYKCFNDQITTTTKVEIPDFTFDEWLSDFILRKEYSFHGRPIIDIPNGLEMACAQGILSQEDCQKIRKYQKNTFGIALKINLESEKYRFMSGLKRTNDKAAYLNIEIGKIRKYLDENASTYQKTLRDGPDFLTIQGSTYLKVIKAYREMRMGAIDHTAIYPHEMELFKCLLYHKYLRWLIFQVKNLEFNKKTKREINPNLKLSDILIYGLSPEKVTRLYTKWDSSGRCRSKDLTLFLKHLGQKGYYRRHVKDKEFVIIAKNDFNKPNLKISRNHVVPIINSQIYKSPPYSLVPEADTFLTFQSQ